jgi:hypothetical protein
MPIVARDLLHGGAQTSAVRFLIRLPCVSHGSARRMRLGTAHHVFTYCNAVHQGLKRIGSDPDLATGSVEPVRAVLHGAMAIYLIRYLNVPPARLPGESDDRLKELPSAVEEIRAALLDAFDRQHRGDKAADLVARHLTLGHPAESIMATLAHALSREDAGFHPYQIFEAGGRLLQQPASITVS